MKSQLYLKNKESRGKNAYKDIEKFKERNSEKKKNSDA